MLLILRFALFLQLYDLIILSFDLIRHQPQLLFESYVLYDKALVWASHHGREVRGFNTADLAVTLTNLSLHADCSIFQGLYEQLFLN